MIWLTPAASAKSASSNPSHLPFNFNLAHESPTPAGLISEHQTLT
ncbi:MAG: hypothetical protein U1D41_16510 [Nitrosomonas sp.]|nr:hypothetical protein [Nitrosomonas sp.]MDP1787825.1 hypothetical protein [Nitrosomonas sp.]MDP1933935.1 hypothetical protein [Nitrosomonas sp.]MDP2224329.1 hypothetical protein [Nitrosomonas sp.]MDP3664404.1 hypothetical protein [Nitrosomonas sp.]MDZ4107715.1 hypothetical protein [Nitrosomonas sp.]